MERVLSAKAMKEYERGLIEGCAVPSLLLMERAALAVYAALCERLDTDTRDVKRVLILCGSGNNAADGLAVARLLRERADVRLKLLCVGERGHATEEWKQQALMLNNMGVLIEDYAGELPECDVAVDAMLGIGISRPLKDKYAQAVKQLNALHDKGVYVMAVDIPSGLHTDEGRAMPLCVCADMTVSFGAIKRGVLLGEGRRYCGELRLQPIGAVDEGMGDEYLLHWREAAKLFPKRDPLGHKGSFGKVLCICGSERMPGAAILNARAVLRAGAGMVKLISPNVNRELIISAVPEAMFVPAEECGSAELEAALAWADTLLIGCGLGEAAAGWLKRKELLGWGGCIVLDADALNAMAADKSFLQKRASDGLATILTPHAGELARLFGADKLASADKLRDIAAQYSCVLVAKNATTLITDGKRIFYNTEGNDGMATAGSGDVLAGIVGALACVCEHPMDAACLGVSMHAHCGHLAAERMGRAALTATALIEELAEVGR